MCCYNLIQWYDKALVQTKLWMPPCSHAPHENLYATHDPGMWQSVWTIVTEFP